MITVDVTQNILALDSTPVTVLERSPDPTMTCPTCGQPHMELAEVTIRKVFINALLGMYQEDRNLTAEERMQRADLAQRVYSQDECELSIQEAALIQKLLNRTELRPHVFAQAYRALEGDEEK